MQNRTTVFALAFGTAVLAPAAAAAQEATYSGSLQYSTGGYYFTERTNSAYLVNELSLEFDRLRISGSLPVIWQSTPWLSYSPGGGVPTGGTQQGEVSDGLGQRGRDRDGTGPTMAIGADASARAAAAPPAPRFATVRDGRIALENTTSYDELGVGDPTLRAEVDVTPAGPGEWTVWLGGEVKPALADPDQGFGTGAWDGGVNLSVARRLGSAYLFADVGYLVLGDMEEVELQDPLTYSAGVGTTLPGGTVGMVANVSGSTRILKDTDPPLQVGAGLNFQVAPGRSVGTGISVGLSESSPDVSVSAGWMVEL